MKVIVAVDQNWGIGKDNDLLTHIPGDLKYFKEKTTGKIIVMGRKTLESLPGKKPLPNRTNIVLTSDVNYDAGCKTCHSYAELQEELKQYDTEEVFITGGAQVYRETLEWCDTFFITKMYDSFDADRFFPNLDEREDMEIVWESEMQEHNGLKYQFLEYRRK